MANERRGFIKKTLTAGAVTAIGATAALASGKQNEATSSGVVVGKSSKKEVLYKETKEWEAYYKANY